MKRLQERDAAGVVSHHNSRSDMLIGFRDSEHKPRIEATLLVIRAAVERFARMPIGITELGCAGGDLCGPFSREHMVFGMDCRPEAIAIAKDRYPDGIFSVGDITRSTGLVGTDLLILCEILEHLSKPEHLVKDLLPWADSAVISHPLDGDLQGDLSGGDHLWSFSQQDHEAFFAMGGHKIEETQYVTIGGYTFVVSRSTRI